MRKETYVISLRIAHRRVYRVIAATFIATCGKKSWKPNTKGFEQVGETHLAINMADNINHPQHYKSGGIEVIDVIEAFSLGFTWAMRRNTSCGRAVKRQTQKDIQKAVWYLERYCKSKSEIRNPKLKGKEVKMLDELNEIIEWRNFLAWYQDATVEEIAIARRNNAAKLDELTRKYAKEIDLMEIILPRRDTERRVP